MARLICQRCGSKCVVDASLICLLCGYEGRPGADRAVAAPSTWGSTVLSPASIAPTDLDGFTDEESA